jgi:transcriptional regulator with XRE-family HTH domain
MPRGAKVAVTHDLKERGYTLEETATLLGIGRRSAARYIKETPDEKWNDYRKNIAKLVEVKENDIVANALSQISGRLNDAPFRDIVGAYKIISDVQRERNKPGETPLVQVNNILAQAMNSAGEAPDDF